MNSSTAAIRLSIVRERQIKFPDLRYAEDIVFWHSVALVSGVAVSTTRTVSISQHPASAMSSSRDRHRGRYPIRFDSYTSQPSFQHLASRRDSLPGPLERGVDLYLDGMVTGSWRSTLYLGLQDCARRAARTLRHSWRPQTILFRLMAAFPRPLSRLIARSLQSLCPLDRYSVPLSPFLVWLDADPSAAASHWSTD